jgi:hypothetical protein
MEAGEGGRGSPPGHASHRTGTNLREKGEQGLGLGCATPGRGERQPAHDGAEIRQRGSLAPGSGTEGCRGLC